MHYFCVNCSIVNNQVLTLSQGHPFLQVLLGQSECPSPTPVISGQSLNIKFTVKGDLVLTFRT